MWMIYGKKDQVEKADEIFLENKKIQRSFILIFFLINQSKKKT